MTHPANPTELMDAGCFLRLTETMQRFYYSTEPVLTRTEVSTYPLRKDIDLFTSCGFLTISDVLTRSGTAYGLRIDYVDDDGQPRSVQATPDCPARIRFMEGEGNVYRVADCLFEIVKG